MIWSIVFHFILSFFFTNEDILTNSLYTVLFILFNINGFPFSIDKDNCVFNGMLPINGTPILSLSDCPPGPSKKLPDHEYNHGYGAIGVCCA